MTSHNFRTASHGDFLWAGESKVPILGYGNVDIPSANHRSYVYTTLPIARISLATWHHCDSYENKAIGGTLIEDLYDQFVLEYLP